MMIRMIILHVRTLRHARDFIFIVHIFLLKIANRRKQNRTSASFYGHYELNAQRSPAAE